MTHRGQVLSLTERLVVEQCCNCHCWFAISEDLHDRARADGSVWFHCPNGHSQHYTDTEIKRLRREAEAADRRLAATRAQLDQARAEAEHQAAVARGYKGAMVKTKKRAAKGVCPVPGCRRHFVDVQRHVASKHPDWTAEG